jgi:hypothetical protein
VSDKSKTPNSAKLEAVKFPTTRALLSTHTPELLPDPLEGGYTWDNANAPLFVGPLVSMVDADRALAKDIAALEEKHAIELADAVANAIALCHAEERAALESAAKDVADIEAKMATMVCGRCKGVEFVWSSDVDHHVPCPYANRRKKDDHG